MNQISDEELLKLTDADIDQLDDSALEDVAKRIDVKLAQETKKHEELLQQIKEVDAKIKEANK